MGPNLCFCRCAVRENFAVWLRNGEKRQNPAGVSKFHLSRGNLSRSSVSVKKVLTVLKSTGKMLTFTLDGVQEPRLELVWTKQQCVLHLLPPPLRLALAGHAAHAGETPGPGLSPAPPLLNTRLGRQSTTSGDSYTVALRLVIDRG